MNMNKPGTGWVTREEMDREVEDILRKLHHDMARQWIKQHPDWPAFVVDPERACK